MISAPGGPYFGDLYWRHEPLHWWYAWMGIAHRTPTFLFAPSTGPYARRSWNLVRARLLRRFASPLCVREDVSAAHLAALVGSTALVEVTTDAALLTRVPPLDRHRRPDERGEVRGRDVLPHAERRREPAEQARPHEVP